MKKTIHIRVDGNAQIGHGHYIRCIALAQMLRQCFECHFYSLTFPAGMEDTLRKEGFFFHALPNETAFLEVLSTGSLVVLDGYEFDLTYQQNIKAKQAVLCMIDDAPSGKYLADCLINHAPGNDPALLQIAPGGIHALGPGFMLLRNAYQQKARLNHSGGDSKSVFICFGGSDVKNLTITTLNEVLEQGLFQSVTVVIGSSFQVTEQLQLLADQHPEVTIYKDVPEAEMIGLMEKSRYAIVPCSGMLLEAIALNRTIISGYYVANQQQLYAQYRALNCFVDAQDFNQTALRDALNKVGTASTSTTGIIDGFAPERIRNLFTQLGNPDATFLTEALPEDAEQTFKWAADSGLRTYSFSREPIVWNEHQAWFQEKLLSADCQYYIARQGDSVIGSIRFDKVKDSAVISYLLDPAFQGKGLGTWLLNAGIEQLLVDLPFSFNEITGQVINSNIPSLKSFEKLNFEKTETESIVTFKRTI
ncbi:MAG: UDP-2,4-diacetamido-2,4,6-trideoxy-beta-L-altropyranose hydrolase [Bacteroidota bacterium]